MLNKYDYRTAVKDDIRAYIDDEINLEDYKDKEELQEYLEEVLWIEDTVTGNGSGSYTFNNYEAEENIAHNWDLLQEALEEFGQTDINVIENGAEWADVTIRCYLLSKCIAEVLEEVTR